MTRWANTLFLERSQTEAARPLCHLCGEPFPRNFRASKDGATVTFWTVDCATKDCRGGAIIFNDRALEKPASAQEPPLPPEFADDAQQPQLL